MSEVLFIVNPISGKGRKGSVTAAIESRGFNYVLTEYAGQAEEIARNTTAEVVVAVGGDGTLNEVGRGLLGTGKTLGLLPCGSGDGLALCLGISRNVKKALDVIENGIKAPLDPAVNPCVQPLDAGYINGHPFFSVCGAGLDADVSRAFAEANKRGVLTYVEQALRLWHNYAPNHFTLDIDGQCWSQDVALVTVANSNQWGNQAKVAPHADCSDGLLDVTVLDMFHNIEIPDLALKLMAGHCDWSRRVHCYKGRNIVIERPAPGAAHFDGDWFDTTARIEISVEPAALKVIVPR